MRAFLTLIALVLIAPTADAGPLKRRGSTWTQTTTIQSSAVSSSCSPYGCSSSSSSTSVSVSSSGTGTTTIALDSVNAKRAARGLPPYRMCPLLTAAAERAASFRAAHLMFGHTSNDFSFLEGTGAAAAGCAAYPMEYGFMSCAMYDGYQYAGAAWVQGRDGKMYCHLFVR